MQTFIFPLLRNIACDAQSASHTTAPRITLKRILFRKIFSQKSVFSLIVRELRERKPKYNDKRLKMCNSTKYFSCMCDSDWLKVSTLTRDSAKSQYTELSSFNLFALTVLLIYTFNSP
jgi:hypothetical protein